MIPHSLGHFVVVWRDADGWHEKGFVSQGDAWRWALQKFGGVAGWYIDDRTTL